MEAELKICDMRAHDRADKFDRITKTKTHIILYLLDIANEKRLSNANADSGLIVVLVPS